MCWAIYSGRGYPIVWEGLVLATWRIDCFHSLIISTNVVQVFLRSTRENWLSKRRILRSSVILREGNLVF